MNTFYTAAIIATALTWTSATKTLAQDEPQSPPATPPPPPPVAIIHDAQQVAENAAHTVQNDVERQIYQAQQQLSNVRGRIGTFVRHVGGAGKSLVVRSSDMTPPEQANLQEDLTVMTHILDKTLSERFADDQSARVAMGISVSFVPGEAPTRSLYLDGYGALFFVKVNFPLLAPPVEKNVEKEKAPADSTWEEAREEVYGQPATSASNHSSRPEYDAAKVSALKAALLDSLKDGSNIRSVKSDESITVCVIGASAEPSKHTGTSSGGGGFGGGGGSGSQDSDYAEAVANFDQVMRTFPTGQDDAAEKTTLTIRVKKADCEAFANGKLTADAFQKRAVIKIYGEPAGAS